MQHFAKVVVDGTLLGLAMIMSMAMTSAALSLSVTSESKESEEQSSIAKPKEEISVELEQLVEFEVEEVPLDSFEEVEMSLVLSYNESATSDTENEAVDDTDDVDPLTYAEDDGIDILNTEDEDPLGYYESLQPDWSVIPLDPSLVQTVLDESKEYDVDPAVVIALMQSESGFQTDVVSSAGCYGLMQLHPAYYPDDLYDAYRNIHYGVETIGRNLEKTDGDYVKALSIYANGHVGTDFTYQNDVIRRSEEWRVKLQEANIL